MEKNSQSKRRDGEASLLFLFADRREDAAVGGIGTGAMIRAAKA